MELFLTYDSSGYTYKTKKLFFIGHLEFFLFYFILNFCGGDVVSYGRAPLTLSY